MDDDGDPGTDRVAVFQQFDAFGNDMSKPLSSTSSFAWRGQEGSVTDRASGLVYMQARHYDPSIGRFIQADILPVASLTTQGMNRYIYCENDPVNSSDPSGRIGFTALFLGVVFGLFVVAALGMSFAFLVLMFNQAQNVVCYMIGGEDAADAYWDWMAEQVGAVASITFGFIVGAVLTALGILAFPALLIALGAAVAFWLLWEFVVEDWLLADERVPKEDFWRPRGGWDEIRYALAARGQSDTLVLRPHGKPQASSSLG